MLRKTTRVTLFYCIFSCIIAALLLSACGGQVAVAGQGAIVTQQVKNADQVPVTPTSTLGTTTATAQATASATAAITPTPLPTPTPTPLPTVTVNWANAVTLYTVGYANVRAAPFTQGTLIRTVAASQTLTAYGTVNGEILADGGLWYRISAQNSAPEYIYNDLVTTKKPVPVSDNSGKIIKVNLTTQHLYAYNNGVLVNDSLITSGQPGLATPTGTFHIISKLHPTTFYSPWPKGSPYYYDPLPINYALGFQGTLLFLHDATWRGNDFGPGTNVPHTVNGTQMTGSHGCVEMPVAESQWLYNWAPIGTPLIIAY